MAVLIFNLNDRAFFDEEAGQVDGLLERTAAVAAQIQNHPGDVFLREFAEQPGDIQSGAFRLAALAALQLEARIKGGQIDDAQADRFAIRVRQFDDLCFGLLVLEFNFFPDQRHDFPHGGVGGIRRDHREPHFAVLRAADQLHHLAQLHIDYFHRLAITLGDGNDPVVRFQFFAAHGRAGLELLDLAVTVLGAEQRADAEQRELHRDGKVLQLRLAHVVGVRIIDAGQRGEINLQHIVIIILVERPQNAVVAAGDDFDDFVRFLLVQFLLQVFVAEPFPPEFPGFSQIFRAGEGFAVEDEALALAARKIKLFRFEEVQDIVILLVEAFAEARKDYPRRRGVALLGEIIKRVTVFVKLLQV